MTRASSPWALPLTLAAVPASFHVYLLLSGTTLAEAQDAGWVLKPEVRVFFLVFVFCRKNQLIKNTTAKTKYTKKT
jgi:hypothetical protein